MNKIRERLQKVGKYAGYFYVTRETVTNLNLNYVTEYDITIELPENPPDITAGQSQPVMAKAEIIELDIDKIPLPPKSPEKPIVSPLQDEKVLLPNKPMSFWQRLWQKKIQKPKPLIIKNKELQREYWERMKYEGQQNEPRT